MQDYRQKWPNKSFLPLHIHQSQTSMGLFFLSRSKRKKLFITNNPEDKDIITFVLKLFCMLAYE